MSVKGLPTYSKFRNYYVPKALLLNNNNNNIIIIIIIVIIFLLTAIGLSPGGSGYFTCIQI